MTCQYNTICNIRQEFGNISFIYICIAVGDPVIKKGGLVSY